MDFKKIFEELRLKENYDEVAEYLSQNNIVSLVEKLIKDKDDIVSIEYIIRITQAIYNNSEVLSPISDNLYDILYEVYRDITGKEIVGSFIDRGSSKVIGKHRYPDLRGTLHKCHFITKEDRGTDARKSLEDWVQSVENTLGRELTKEESKVLMELKWDGVSVIFECDEQRYVTRALTRGETGINEASDITELFKGYMFHDVDEFKGKPVGIKTEVIMPDENLEEINKTVPKPFKNTRSAVSSIVNSNKGLDLSKVDYLEIIPLQVQDFETKEIVKPKVLFDKYPSSIVNIKDYDEVKKTTLDLISKRNGRPVDGIVLRFTDENICKALGRDNNINEYERAYKFPALSKKTRLIDVNMSVGLLGAITPVAVVEPLIMNGNTIQNISLGSIGRLKTLDLHKGDEVIIKYEIVPYLEIDETCERNLDGELIEIPNICPICNSELDKTDLVYKCVNRKCPSLVIGRLVNYINKLSIPYISISTVMAFNKLGILNSIEDLYRLKNHKNTITQTSGFGAKSYKNIINGIESRKTLFDYQVLGSLGIENVGERIFKKILNIYYLRELIDICSNNQINKLTEIGGIKEKTANKICNGINENLDLINFLCSELNIIHDERKYNIKVCFSKVRDKDFEKYLDTQDVMVLEKYNSEVDMLIIKKGASSSKIDKAIKQGKTVMTLEEAYDVFKYHERIRGL